MNTMRNNALILNGLILNILASCGEKYSLCGGVMGRSANSSVWENNIMLNLMETEI